MSKPAKPQNNNLEALDKVALEKEKLILEIKNLTDTGQSRIEIFMKRRFIPVFLPFLTLILTVIFFCIDLRENERAKALDRYNSEVDIVKMVWEDVKDMDTASQEFKTSEKFLIGMLNSNSAYYKKDSQSLGIGVNQRPIMLLTNMNRDIQKALGKIKKNDLLKIETKNSGESAVLKDIPTEIEQGKTVLSVKPQAVVAATNSVAGNALKVYIQYTSAVGKDKAQFLANQLRPYYIMPPIDLVNLKKYDNEIRYYTEADLKAAEQLAKRLEDITGLKFTLKNINNYTIKNTMEIWYCNAQPSQISESR